MEDTADYQINPASVFVGLLWPVEYASFDSAKTAVW
jgi:hypothetical protein